MNEEELMQLAMKLHGGRLVQLEPMVPNIVVEAVKLNVRYQCFGWSQVYTLNFLRCHKSNTPCQRVSETPYHWVLTAGAGNDRRGADAIGNEASWWKIGAAGADGGKYCCCGNECGAEAIGKLNSAL